MAARSNPHSTINQVRDVFPKLGELTDKLLFGNVWERKQLSKARPQPDHGAALRRALSPGPVARPRLAARWRTAFTREEIVEVITHLAFYAGWPNARTAALIAKEVFEERKAMKGYFQQQRR